MSSNRSCRSRSKIHFAQLLLFAVAGNWRDTKYSSTAVEEQQARRIKGTHHLVSGSGCLSPFGPIRTSSGRDGDGFHSRTRAVPGASEAKRTRDMTVRRRLPGAAVPARGLRRRAGPPVGRGSGRAQGRPRERHTDGNGRPRRRCRSAPGPHRPGGQVARGCRRRGCSRRGCSRRVAPT